MSRNRRSGLIGLGIGVAAAAAAGAVGVAAERLTRARLTAKALDSTDDYEEEATSEVIVLASDGVPLQIGRASCRERVLASV